MKGKTLQGDSAHDCLKGSCVDGDIGNFFSPFVDAAGLGTLGLWRII